MIGVAVSVVATAATIVSTYALVSEALDKAARAQGLASAMMGQPQEQAHLQEAANTLPHERGVFHSHLTAPVKNRSSEEAENFEQKASKPSRSHTSKTMR